MQGAIYQLRDGPEWVCRVQTDLGVETPYVLCAPIVARTEWGRLVPKLHIPVKVDGTDFIVVMSQLVAIPTGQIGRQVGEVSAWRDEIVAAIDLLVSGF